MPKNISCIIYTAMQCFLNTTAIEVFPIAYSDEKYFFDIAKEI